MSERKITRRGFVKQAAAAGALPAVLPPLGSSAAQLSVVCVGAHPDDPESGCGGTLARYAALGHAVTVVYLTRGERGIPGKSLDEAATIRTAEAESACRILGAKALFFGQIDGATAVTETHVTAMTRLLTALRPDVVLAHWPVDTHLDHQVASVLAVRGWMALRTPRLYFYEVNSGSQTEGFLPNTYVDISAAVEQKTAALFAHASQDGRGIWREHHELMAQWRGREAGVRAAEAFVQLSRESAAKALPGLS